MLGPKATPVNFTPKKLTPKWEIYKYHDVQEGTADTPPEELKNTPEAKDNYVNINIMLPCGSKMPRGRVTGHKR